MSIRLRLALWYTGFLAVMFLVFAPIVYFTLERQLLLEVDRWLAPPSQRVLRSLDDDGGSLADPVLDLEAYESAGVIVEVLDPNGRVLERFPNLGNRGIPVPDGAFATAWWGSEASFTSTVDGTRYRGLLIPMSGSPEPRGFILAARALDEVDGSLGTVRLFLLVGNALGLLMAVGVGWLIARNGLRPIEEITQTARAIALSQGFSRRLSARAPRGEVGQLAVTFNEMLASLEAAYATQRRFVADASHELRSPLTSIKANVEILRRALDAPREERAEALADVSAEVDRMSRLASDLLLLARADAGHKIEMGRIVLDDLVRDVCRQTEARANGVALEMGPLRRTVVVGNAAWLKQLLLILLDNALKYTPRGSVTLSLDREGDLGVVRVRDTGIGIATEDLPHIFERFYRADKARARYEGGTGIGLAIARWIAEEHGAEILVESEPGEGSTFSLRIPAEFLSASQLRLSFP